MVRLILLGTGLAITAYGAGDLAPEGAPAPIFKTLDEIESRILIDEIPYSITNAGSYYITGNLSNTTADADGITIAANHVTLDLNGYTLFGGKMTGMNSRDGIYVEDALTNLHLYNGTVVGWNRHGINADNATLSVFENLHVSSNNEDGLVSGNNGLMVRCTASRNGFDGLEGNDNTVIKHCTANYNGDNGIQVSESCMVLDSSARNNVRDGIEAFNGSVVNRCVARNNGLFGFDIASGSQIMNCAAYNNSSNGFDLANNVRMKDCVSSENGGHGVRTFSNTSIIDNQLFDNHFGGIRISSSDCRVEGNSVVDNDHNGIKVTSSGSLIIRNRAAGNLTNYNIRINSSFGPIVNLQNGGDASGTPNANHPLANLEF